MKKGEIPWIYNEAFDPHYFSGLVENEDEEIESQTRAPAEDVDIREEDKSYL